MLIRRTKVTGFIGIATEGGWFSLTNISSVKVNDIRENAIRLHSRVLLSEIKR